MPTAVDRVQENLDKLIYELNINMNDVQVTEESAQGGGIVYIYTNIKEIWQIKQGPHGGWGYPWTQTHDQIVHYITTQRLLKTQFMSTL